MAGGAAPAERVARIDGQLPTHCLLGFLVGTTILQVEWHDDIQRLVPTAAVALAGIVAVLLFAGRDSRALRWIAYAGFAFELCFLYAVTLGTMLGTAGFFLAAAVMLGLLAFLIIRVERRMRTAVRGEA